MDAWIDGDSLFHGSLLVAIIANLTATFQLEVTGQVAGAERREAPVSNRIWGFEDSAPATHRLSSGAANLGIKPGVCHSSFEENIDEFAASLIAVNSEVAVDTGDVGDAEALAQSDDDRVGEVHG
jgi:hypothetical protein